jgi:regulator of RNase E activity RraB
VGLLKNKIMMKQKNEIENYEDKSKVLYESGWETWYHDDNWIKTEWIKQGKAYDMMGDSTDRVYASIIKK